MIVCFSGLDRFPSDRPTSISCLSNIGSLKSFLINYCRHPIVRFPTHSDSRLHRLPASPGSERPRLSGTHIPESPRLLGANYSRLLASWVRSDSSDSVTENDVATTPDDVESASSDSSISDSSDDHDDQF
ncbi:hypothetical protein L6452_32803 [Arctium lappa]|uniref:Uncharacterized protein n=1 Tax=Arctium lappa TaxID=4217 RepID=A0ACB8Z4P8_ARCLA|nr:hypothetical protein L6452_32803 [Arctium lappa]